MPIQTDILIIGAGDNGVDYIIRDPEVYRGKDILIAGGGDSALDWTIFLSDVAKSVSLIHRRSSFRGALDSVEKVQELAAAGRINLITEAQAIGLEGEEHRFIVSSDRIGASSRWKVWRRRPDRGKAA